MKADIEWLDSDHTLARVTVESAASRWWRRRHVTADVQRKPDDRSNGYAGWRFTVGGDRVCDHDDVLAQKIERAFVVEDYRRQDEAKRAKLKSPWSEVTELPPARTVKR